ncbi:hypothetical protein CEUSTIGMA_g685.t1 [Chlamydomonas eustigma]|uniref:Uncharacterized protein n=1 Tax=Chlamydomonas eustigma TaxID=1157962 RepID=A0A250WRD4_9CHLO|nr:hypothetical protein CEUSTIGMA_g685.t1 [Chlamydomonas eustigma]|eukprot:GAX73232.1 hypothetical protein CEUSTIGMA_g685.t1 [Chlamydomonas eustigma]
MSEEEDFEEKGAEVSQSRVAERNGSGILLDTPQPQFQAPHFAPLVGHVGPELRTITNAHQFLPKASSPERRPEINEEVLAALTRVAEELNLAQAEFEYRKQLKREVQSFRERGQVIEAEVLDEVANWKLPVGVGNLVARDIAIMDRMRINVGDTVRAPGAEVLIEPLAVPAILESVKQENRWSHFNSVPWLMPKPVKAKKTAKVEVVTDEPQAANIAKASMPMRPSTVKEPSAKMKKESWQGFMAHKRKDAYMARLSEILAANMQRVSKEFAARMIQRAWRKYRARKYADLADAESLRKKVSATEQLGLLEAELELQMAKLLAEDPNRDDIEWKISTMRSMRRDGIQVAFGLHSSLSRAPSRGGGQNATSHRPSNAGSPLFGIPPSSRPSQAGVLGKPATLRMSHSISPADSSSSRSPSRAALHSTQSSLMDGLDREVSLENDAENGAKEEASTSRSKRSEKKPKKKKTLKSKGRSIPRETACEQVGEEHDMSSDTAPTLKAKKAVVVTESRSTVQVHKGRLVPVTSVVDTSPVPKPKKETSRGAAAAAAAATANVTSGEMPKEVSNNIEAAENVEDEEGGVVHSVTGFRLQVGADSISNESDSVSHEFEFEEEEEEEENSADEGSSSSSLESTDAEQLQGGPEDPNADTGVVDFPETQTRPGTPVGRGEPPATQEILESAVKKIYPQGFAKISDMLVFAAANAVAFRQGRNQARAKAGLAGLRSSAPAPPVSMENPFKAVSLSKPATVKTTTKSPEKSVPPGRGSNATGALTRVSETKHEATAPPDVTEALDLIKYVEEDEEVREEEEEEAWGLPPAPKEGSPDFLNSLPPIGIESLHGRGLKPQLTLQLTAATPPVATDEVYFTAEGSDAFDLMFAMTRLSDPPPNSPKKSTRPSLKPFERKKHQVPDSLMVGKEDAGRAGKKMQQAPVMGRPSQRPGRWGTSERQQPDVNVGGLVLTGSHRRSPSPLSALPEESSYHTRAQLHQEELEGPSSITAHGPYVEQYTSSRPVGGSAVHHNIQDHGQHMAEAAGSSSQSGLNIGGMGRVGHEHHGGRIVHSHPAHQSSTAPAGKVGHENPHALGVKKHHVQKIHSSTVSTTAYKDMQQEQGALLLGVTQLYGGASTAHTPNSDVSSQAQSTPDVAWAQGSLPELLNATQLQGRNHQQSPAGLSSLSSTPPDATEHAWISGSGHVPVKGGSNKLGNNHIHNHHTSSAADPSFSNASIQGRSPGLSPHSNQGTGSRAGGMTPTLTNRSTPHSHGTFEPQENEEEEEGGGPFVRSSRNSVGEAGSVSRQSRSRGGGLRLARPSVSKPIRLRTMVSMRIEAKVIKVARQQHTSAGSHVAASQEPGQDLEDEEEVAEKSDKQAGQTPPTSPPRPSFYSQMADKRRRPTMHEWRLYRARIQALDKAEADGAGGLASSIKLDGSGRLNSDMDSSTSMMALRVALMQETIQGLQLKVHAEQAAKAVAEVVAAHKKQVLEQQYKSGDIHIEGWSTEKEMKAIRASLGLAAQRLGSRTNSTKQGSETLSAMDGQEASMVAERGDQLHGKLRSSHETSDACGVSDGGAPGAWLQRHLAYIQPPPHVNTPRHQNSITGFPRHSSNPTTMTEGETAASSLSATTPTLNIGPGVDANALDEAMEVFRPQPKTQIWGGSRVWTPGKYNPRQRRQKLQEQMEQVRQAHEVQGVRRQAHRGPLIQPLEESFVEPVAIPSPSLDQIKSIVQSQDLPAPSAALQAEMSAPPRLVAPRPALSVVIPSLSPFLQPQASESNIPTPTLLLKHKRQSPSGQPSSPSSPSSQNVSPFSRYQVTSPKQNQYHVETAILASSPTSDARSPSVAGAWPQLSILGNKPSSNPTSPPRPSAPTLGLPSTLETEPLSQLQPQLQPQSSSYNRSGMDSVDTRHQLPRQTSMGMPARLLSIRKARGWQPKLAEVSSKQKKFDQVFELQGQSERVKDFKGAGLKNHAHLFANTSPRLRHAGKRNQNLAVDMGALQPREGIQQDLNVNTTAPEGLKTAVPLWLQRAAVTAPLSSTRSNRLPAMTAVINDNHTLGTTSNKSSPHGLGATFTHASVETLPVLRRTSREVHDTHQERVKFSGGRRVLLMDEGAIDKKKAGLSVHLISAMSDLAVHRSVVQGLSGKDFTSALPTVHGAAEKLPRLSASPKRHMASSASWRENSSQELNLAATGLPALSSPRNQSSGLSH